MAASAIPSRKFSATLVALVAAALLITLAVLPQAAGATTGTLTVTTDTTLTEDHNGNVIIGADGVTLDCAGHALLGDGPESAIFLNGRTGATVTNCTISGLANGIFLQNSNFNTLTDNVLELAAGSSGIDLVGSSNNTITGNSIANAGSGFSLDGSNDNTIERNTVTNSAGSSFTLIASQRNILTANVSRDSQRGFDIATPLMPGDAPDASDNVLTDNEATGNTHYGYTLSAPSNVLRNNLSDGGTVGIHVLDTSGNLLEANTTTNADIGILIENGAGNAMLANVVHSTDNGIVLADCGPNDPLDADAGLGNNCQNAPELADATPGATTQIAGTLHSTPNREFRIDLFATSSAVPAGQAERFLGSATVTTDAGGDATIDVTLPDALSGATTITGTATDLVTGDSSPFSNAVSASREVALAQGWNLVGWSGATPVREATAGLGESLLAAFTWDTTGQDFRSFRPTAPGFLNTLDELTLGDGVWANLSQATTWLQPPFAQARDVALAAGFNLVMWTGPDATPVADAVAGIAGNLEGLFLWDAIPQHFLIYRSNVPAALNSAKTLDYGVGVWLRMTQASIWSQPALAGPPPAPPEEEPAPFALTSTAFAANALIPAVYTCDGANTSPPLALTGLPADTVTLALIMDDPDAPGGTWVHWVAFNIAPSPLIEANIAALGTSGINSFGLTGYGGPCPPSGTHRYFFTVYALDAELALAPGASKAELLAALDGHVLATAELVGLFR